MTFNYIIYTFVSPDCQWHHCPSFPSVSAISTISTALSWATSQILRLKGCQQLMMQGQLLDNYQVSYKMCKGLYLFLSLSHRILTTLMISTSFLVSPQLRDALLIRIDHLLNDMDPSNYNNPRRVVQFLRNIKYNYRPMLEKCNRILLSNVPRMNAENISIIMGLYQSLQFNNCDFTLAAKQRLIELIDSSTDPFSFTKLFVTLAPFASPEIRKGLVWCINIITRMYSSLTNGL